MGKSCRCKSSLRPSKAWKIRVALSHWIRKVDTHKIVRVSILPEGQKSVDIAVVQIESVYWSESAQPVNLQLTWDQNQPVVEKV